MGGLKSLQPRYTKPHDSSMNILSSAGRLLTDTAPMLRGGITAAALVFAACCFGQSNLATVNGDVADPSNQAVPNAVIKIRNNETGAVRATTSSATGSYQIPGLPPGDYTVEATAAGFAATTRTMRLEVGQALRLNLALAIGEQRTSVEARANADILKTEDASLGEVVESISVRQLPLNGRMLLDLALTVPGSHQSHGAQTGDIIRCTGALDRDRL